MKKIALSLIALAALSTVSYAAGNRSWDLRDSQYYNTSGVSEPARTDSSVMEAALAVESGAATTSFERLTKLSIENDQGRH